MEASPTTHATPAIATLFVVATPIGNLDDLSPRALHVLRSVAAIAAEDTRVSRTLLHRHGIHTDIFPAHAHNEEIAAQQVLERLQRGQSVALISDAGTPAVSDPGSRIVAAAHALGYTVTPIPGPSAVLALLCAAGLEGEGFRFIGFLPSQGGARRRRLEALRDEPAIVVFFEAPHRIAATLEALASVFDDARPLVIGRELTKRFEEIARLPVSAASAWLAAQPHRSRGEFVLAIGPKPFADAPVAPGLASDPAAAAFADRLLKALASELPAASAARVAASVLEAPRQALYQRLLALKASP
jgi:16S rRNA (cytidine1402-2'-O)-methyltransferase